LHGCEAAVTVDDLPYTVGFERFDHHTVQPITVRVTYVYRREYGE
jgi:hypothetical protein